MTNYYVTTCHKKLLCDNLPQKIFNITQAIGYRHSLANNKYIGQLNKWLHYIEPIHNWKILTT